VLKQDWIGESKGSKWSESEKNAFLGQRLLSLTLHGRSTALNCAITTVQYQPYQYRRILYGHVVVMVFTVGYIINQCSITIFFNNKSGLSTRFVCGVSLNITV